MAEVARPPGAAPAGRHLVRDLALGAALVVAYFLAARFGLSLAFVNSSASAVWPPTGIALAALLVLGRRFWPAIAVGAFLANWDNSGHVPASLAIAVGNTLEAWLGAFAVDRWAGGARAFEHPSTVFRFIGLAGLLAPAVSASVGVAALVGFGLADAGDASAVWVTWWFGDIAGAIVLGPALILAVRPPLHRLPRRPLEGAILLACMSLVALSLWGPANRDVLAGRPGAFAAIPFVVWAALRIGPRGTALAALVLDAFAVWGTLAGRGPFSLDDPNDSLVYLQAYLIVVAVLTLPTAALALQQSRSQAGLREAAERLERQVAERTADLDRSLRSRDEAERVTGRGSWEWDVTHDKAVWSAGMYRLFGLDPATFVNSNENFLAMVVPEDRERMGKAIADALAKPSRFYQEYRLRRPDGTILHIHGEGNVVVDGDGKVRRMYGVVQDVTELRAIQAAEQKARERFQRVFDASPVGITLTKDDGRVVDVNPAFCRLTGYGREELLHPDFRMASLYEDPQDRQRLIAALRAAGMVRDRDLRWRRKDGAVRHLLGSLEFVDVGGGTTILGLYQDITERAKAQAEREARIAVEAELERLRRTDQFRTEFINSTAHELRTPLTPLLLGAAALRPAVAGNALAARQLATIERAAERLQRVVGDMVAAADLQARSIALDRQRLDLDRQLAAAVAGHQDAAHRAVVTLDLGVRTGLTVLADEQRLQLALGHLLGNALKFTPAGGRVTLAARRWDDQARIEVADTGQGLTQGQIEGLWKPYGQAHDKSQRTDSGSGLGLYVTKGIVDLHGGQVGVESAGPDKGSLFWFTLPLAPGNVDPLRKRPAEPEPKEPRRNLNPTVREDDGALA